MPSASPNFYCPSGGEWYFCFGSQINFLGCCTTNPCSNNSSCPLGNLRPAGFNADLFGILRDADCTAGPFFTCAAEPTFIGCCKSNPCNTGGGCPETNLSAASWDLENWSPISWLPYLNVGGARPGAAYIASAPNLTHAAPVWNPRSNMRLSPGAMAGIIISSMVALLILSVCTTVLRFKRYSKQKTRRPLQNYFQESSKGST